MDEEMKQALTKIGCSLLLAAITVPVLAEHGPLSTTRRDAWVDSAIEELSEKGLAPKRDKPAGEMTNLEVAQWTANAAREALSQAEDSPSSGSAKRLKPELNARLVQLAQEFKDELAAMNVNLAKLEERVFRQQHRSAYFADLQRDYLRLTGTQLNGYSRGYFYNFRGQGAPGSLGSAVYPGAVYGPMTYDCAMFVELDLKSIPVPYLLFDARLRYWRSVGMYYSDPLGDRTNLDLRWLSLAYYSPMANFTAGDFYRSYTPLTLWNTEVPVYTFLEPTPLERERRDVEEVVFMDHGPDWHLRGFQAYTSKDLAKFPVLSGFSAQAMAGSLKSPSEARFGDYYAGSRLTASFLNKWLELGAQGLLIWADPDSANVPYLPDFSLNWARQYQVGSLTLKAFVPIQKDLKAAASLEYAGSLYRDDAINTARDFSDWALLGDASVNYSGFRFSVKAFQVEPFFYSPGAQTNRYSAVPGNGYMNTGGNLDEYLYGYLKRFPLQMVGRPSFACYDRLLENALPYGDATPNRQGILLGFSTDLGLGGWLKPQASLIADAREIQPNLVLAPDGSQSLAVDSASNTAEARVYSGYELAVNVDLAKLNQLEDSTYQAGLDFKHQTTKVAKDASAFSVDTFIASLDFNPPMSGFDGLLGSVAFELAQSTGGEYVLSGQGSPPTYAGYPFYFDSSSLGSYEWLPLNITRTAWVFGLKYPLTTTINFRGGYFIVHYTWKDVPDFDRWDKIWRLTYEVSF
jgi:hypothetical protein